MLNDPNTVLPDETVDKRRTITLGGTALELTYVGQNHSDSTLVMRLPKERIVFVVDLLPVGQMPGRGMIDFYPMEAEQSIKQILSMDWERLIPGHPGDGGRLGTKKDAQDQLTFLQDASAAVKAEAQQGRCWEPVETQLKLPKYRQLARLRSQPAVHAAALLRAVGARHLAGAAEPSASAQTRCCPCENCSQGGV